MYLWNTQKRSDVQHLRKDTEALEMVQLRVVIFIGDDIRTASRVTDMLAQMDLPWLASRYYSIIQDHEQAPIGFGRWTRSRQGTLKNTF